MTTPRNDPNQVPDPSAYLPPSNASIAPPLDGAQGSPWRGPAAGGLPVGGAAVGGAAGPAQPYQAYQQQPGQPYGPPQGQSFAYPPPYGAQPGQPYGAQPGQPYGPPPGQPFGPPQGQSFAYPPPMPGGGYPYAGQPAIPAPPAKRRSKARLIGALVVLVLVIGGGIVGYVRSQSAPQNAQPGDCIHYVSESDSTVVDCNSAKAQYRVESRIENQSSTTGCDAVDDADVTLYSMQDTKKPFTLCVSLVLHEGSCVSSDGDVVDCSAPDVIAKVTSIHEGTSDPGVCAAGELPRAYTLRPRVVCLKQMN